MNETDKMVSLIEYVEQNTCISAVVPENTSCFSKESGTTHRITAIQGIVRNHVNPKCKNATLYPEDVYDVIPGDQYIGIRVTLTIQFEYVDDYYEDEEYVIEISDERDCCEIWGSFLSEEDLSGYIGAELLDLYFTDTLLKTEYIRKIASYKDRDDYHNIQFVNFKTNKGVFQFTVYNCHNGYYGHDVSVTHNGYKVYKTQI